MQAQPSHNLVPMRVGEDGLTFFSADFYLGRSLQASANHTRSAMLGKFHHAGGELRHAIARAMDQLTASPDALLRRPPTINRLRCRS